jgi:hypothetical protein
MELNNLLNESAQGFKSLQADASRLADKWTATGLLEGLSNEQEKNSMAMILENQAKQLVSEVSATGTGVIGGSGAQEAWAGVALPLVRKVFAQIAAKDFVSVQPMNLPSGLVFYLDFKYDGTSESLYGNVSNNATKMTPATEVADGLYGAGQFGFSMRPEVAAGTAIASSNAVTMMNGVTLTGKDLVVVAAPATADLKAVRAFSTGLAGELKEHTYTDGTNLYFVVDTTAATTCSLTYYVQPSDNTRGDFEDAGAKAPITIPSINVELASESIVAKTRKLKAQWTPEFAQDLNAYHSVDAEAELTSILSEYISMEIDLEILDMLIADAATVEYWSAGNNRKWDGTAWADLTSDFYNTQGQWFQTLGTKIQKVSNKIHQKTLRGGANFLVVSPEVATILESIPGYAADTNGDKMDFAMGVQKVGQLNSRFRVYKNPYMTETTILMGYRGSQFLETGAVYAPYIPLMMTPLVYDPNTFTPRKGIMTRYAKKMVRPEFYGKIHVGELAGNI